jgi:hypothetical protein
MALILLKLSKNITNKEGENHDYKDYADGNYDRCL